MPVSVHVLVLAAGGSRRLGRPKQLERVGGRGILERVLSAAVGFAGHDVTVVLGAHASALTPLVSRFALTTVINRSWEEGLGGSIRTGMAAVPAGCEAVLILLGDQAAVSSEDLRRLGNAWNGADNQIAASAYAGHVGVPALFPRICFSELAALRGDEGARQLLQRNSYRLLRVPMPNAGFDVDTEDDLRQLNQRYAARQSEASTRLELDAIDCQDSIDFRPML